MYVFFITLLIIIPLSQSFQEVLAAVAQGTHVILSEHSNSERGYLKVFLTFQTFFFY